MKAQLVHRRGRLWLKRPGCACKMDRVGDLRLCSLHRPRQLKSLNYLLRAWVEYEQTPQERSGK